MVRESCLSSAKTCKFDSTIDHIQICRQNTGGRRSSSRRRRTINSTCSHQPSNIMISNRSRIMFTVIKQSTGTIFDKGMTLSFAILGNGISSSSTSSESNKNSQEDGKNDETACNDDCNQCGSV